MFFLFACTTPADSGTTAPDAATVLLELATEVTTDLFRAIHVSVGEERLDAIPSGGSDSGTLALPEDADPDAWETDDVVALSNGADKALLAQPDGDNYAGIFSATPMGADNCFFSIAVEDPQQEPGFYIFEVLEQNDTGAKLVIEVTPAGYSVANIINAMGDGTTLGVGTITGDLRGMRIQILPTEVIFELKDTAGWQTAATLDTAPTWLSAPVLLGFGYRSASAGEEAAFDDFSVEAPL